MNLATLWLLLSSLPDLIKLLNAIQKGIDEANVDKKVTDDLKTLHEAFSAKDASKINALFNS